MCCVAVLACAWILTVTKSAGPCDDALAQGAVCEAANKRAAASAALLSVHKIGNQATHSRIAWLPEEHNLMGIVVFGEMPSRSFYGFFDMKLPKTSRLFQLPKSHHRR